MPSPAVPPLDVPAVEAATGWSLVHLPVVASTHDEAAARARAGAPPRTAIVADEQVAGRGREGRRFLSPPGGLYVSMIVAAPRSDDPAPVVAAAAVAACEAVEAFDLVDVGIKWPNDIWIGGRKVAGILLERAEGRSTALVGIGMNLALVPVGLDPGVASRTTCLADALGTTPSRTDVLSRLLIAMDRHLGDASEGGDRQGLEDAWRGRLALLGCSVRFRVGAAEVTGTLEDVSFEEGLLVRDAAGPRWRPAAHVQDLAAAGR